KELARSPLRAVVFAELLGLKPQRALQTAQAARQFLEWVNPPGSTQEPTISAAELSPQTISAFCFRDGTCIEPIPCVSPARSERRLTPSLSPHAPYSTHALLYDLAAAWAKQARATL